MRVMSRKKEKRLRRLLLAAGGDTGLLNSVLRERSLVYPFTMDQVEIYLRQQATKNYLKQ